MQLLNLTAACLLSTSFTVSAWSINGHLMVANIAESLLSENTPDSLSAANTLLKYLEESNPDMTTHENEHAFVECATFADDLKYHGEGWQADYHFIDFPNIVEGKASDYDIVENPNKITVALDSIVAWLSGKEGDDYKTSSMYTHIMGEFDNDEKIAKSYALRLLIHYMGDLVQPLHCESLFSKEFPQGDKGANDFPLKSHYSVDELHALWDKVLYSQKDNIARPFTSDTWDAFQPQVTDVMTTYAYAVQDKSLYESLDYDSFAHESFDIAVQLYAGLTEDAAVPQEYQDKWLPVAYERLNLGGHRLYYTINYIFGDSVSEELEVFLQ